MRDVQIRLDGSDVITDAQQTGIKALVQAIGQEMQRRGALNPYQSISLKRVHTYGTVAVLRSMPACSRGWRR